jgi:hypothetical protein
MADPWAGISGLGVACAGRGSAPRSPLPWSSLGAESCIWGTNDDSVASSCGWTVNTKIGAPAAAVTVTILLAWIRA